MGEGSSVRVGDQILEFKSLNLRELMKENDEDEIREHPEEHDSANRRQTMGSILVGDGGKTLRDVIQADRSKAWEPPRKCRKVAGSRLLKNVFRVKKKFEEEEEEEGEESANLLGAERSPSVVDSVRLRAPDGDGAAAIRVFLVGRSPPNMMDGAAANQRIPWRFLKRKLRFRNIACCGSSWNAVAEHSNHLNSAVPVVLPPTEESDDAVSWSNSDPLQERDRNLDGNINGNINGRTASPTGANNTDQSGGRGCVSAEPPANSSEEVNSTSAGGGGGGGEGRQFASPSFDGNLEPADGSVPTGMNLAAALAAERQLRAAQDRGSLGSAAGQAGSRGSPFRVSLMSLLEEADERIYRGANGGSKPTPAASSPSTDGWEEAQQPQPTEGVDPLCCVCMVRRKGAAFIPCGHTFCRFCSRELWVSRGSCPLCNKYIIEILDIF